MSINATLTGQDLLIEHVNKDGDVSHRTSYNKFSVPAFYLEEKAVRDALSGKEEEPRIESIGTLDKQSFKKIKKKILKTMTKTVTPSLNKLQEELDKWDEKEEKEEKEGTYSQKDKTYIEKEEAAILTQLKRAMETLQKMKEFIEK